MKFEKEVRGKELNLCSNGDKLPLKDQPSLNGFLEHKAGSINRRNDSMPLGLCVGWRLQSFCISFKQDKFHSKKVGGW